MMTLGLVTLGVADRVLALLPSNGFYASTTRQGHYHGLRALWKRIDPTADIRSILWAI